jgi:alpha-D-ribose 1-methylphosphonate 5-triphosphate diphosphatase
MEVFSNARIVLADRVLHGAVALQDGRIAAIEASGQGGMDFDVDFLLPGVVDLHTDNLERQVLPRSNARWPSRSAMLAHDSHCAAAGITTVFDALCLGDLGMEQARVRTFEEGVADLRFFSGSGLLKTEHFLHLRCELPAPEMPVLLRRAIDDPLVRMVSLMDHSPGTGQYADIERYRQMREADGYTDQEISAAVDLLQANQAAYHDVNRGVVLELARARGIPVASHDDRTVEEVARNHAEGITIAEFPVTMAAARAAREHGIAAIAGAPNIVRGGSHSGNVSALDLIRAGVVDALASDYVPAAMIEAAFRVFHEGVLDLPAAIALVTSGPAAMAGLTDRGEIAPGLRADLVRVRVHEGIPVIRAVWREGMRVA